MFPNLKTDKFFFLGGGSIHTNTQTRVKISDGKHKRSELSENNNNSLPQKYS